ncbi:hypothetical protein [Azospirillum brasilense]|uniref:Pepco domain-containing protein n=1 Tax=Azospirillum brasilense TaxID=192 RepID=UPI001EDC190D|nr:hypothetical protein [Azospirillum brasilense]UKJ75924.1 hypothetical protein H1Q64_17020 [Azospirillum brasilense]
MDDPGELLYLALSCTEYGIIHSQYVFGETFMSKSTIPVIVTRTSDPLATKSIVAKAAEAVREVANIDTEVLRNNLSELIGRVSKVIEVAEASAGGLTLTEVEVGVEINAEGGVALIGTASVGATASISLTFQRK